MIHKIFAVYDSKAASFMTPYFALNQGLAIRSFAHLARDQNSYVSSFPTDFTLFELGSIDLENGIMTQHDHAQNLGTAAAFLSIEE
jgi:hypothetical protein